MIPQVLPATPNSQSTVLSALRTAAHKTGLDFDYLLNTAMRESSLDSQAKSKGSSASGLFQFIDQTWLGLMKQFGNRYGLGAYAGAIQQTSSGQYVVASADTKAAILALRQDPEVSAVMAGESAKQTKQSLECALGREVCGGELYAAHFLGPSGARRLIQLNERSPDSAADVAFPQAAKGNRAVFYRADGTSKTVGEVYASLVDRPNAQTPAAPNRSATQPQLIAQDIPSTQPKLMPVVAPEAKEKSAASEATAESSVTTPSNYTAVATASPAPQMTLSPLPMAPVTITAGLVQLLASLTPMPDARRAI
jgi:hypothetical protein